MILSIKRDIPSKKKEKKNAGFTQQEWQRRRSNEWKYQSLHYDGRSGIDEAKEIQRSQIMKYHVCKDEFVFYSKS